VQSKVSIRGEKVNQQDSAGRTSGLRAILLVSVLGLFLEMLLIRWIGTEVRIFAYLQNTVLVVCFLGLGLGLFTSQQPNTLRQTLIPLALLVLLLAIPLSRRALGYSSELLSVLGDPVIWGELGAANLWKTVLYVTSGLAITAFVLILVLDTFVPIGRFLGRLIDDHPRIIAAYSANVAGSLLGTWFFVLLSSFHQPPIAWIAVVAVMIFLLLRRTDRWQWLNLALLLAVVVLAWFAGRVPGSVQVVWSPYQKLVAEELNPVEGRGSEYLITVNNTGFQVMSDLSAFGSDSDPSEFALRSGGLTLYDIPLHLHPNAKRYLVVGAGAGNDAAGGLRQGAEQITVVEIDPAIIELGRLYHPERPYSSPSVTIVNDDARSFFATCDEKFDVIAFGLLDSHTTTSLTNARLDHYVYTRESIAEARSLLAPGGIMTISFLPQRLYIADRIAAVMGDVFDEEPIYFAIPVEGEGWGYIMFVAGDLASARTQIAQDQQLATFVDWSIGTKPVPSLSLTTKVATDDWPYIYLERPKIPVLYFLLAGLMVGIMIWSTWRWRVPGFLAGWDRSYWHFFFLGAAFLLLEVQNVSKASAVLGNTWQVNAVIVSGVLSMSLLANLLAQMLPRLPLVPVYVVLLGTCLGLYCVDLARFAFLPFAAKALIVGALTNIPALLSGIIFIRSLAIVPRKDLALGANMIGSMVGALLQSVAFVSGIRALLLLVAGLYALSFVARPATRGQEPRERAVLDTRA
jgi:spermidine synthase